MNIYTYFTVTLSTPLTPRAMSGCLPTRDYVFLVRDQEGKINNYDTYNGD